uniref:ATP synthase subunit a n=1 Tax=Eumeta variegata TaxID=1368026 RepID=A0A410SP07_9NEOP|nr:ATP synthase F0 subunit 6 [Eumeta variegata]QAT97927.1 ATP synthase F0 subunit 6 [Eumeta variegata]QOX09142.1 ATP synthase F0 subunit 6 [Eumeta variegata]
MMTNLFSIFDPSTNIFNMSINWLSTTLGIMFIPMMFWFIPNRYMYMWNLIFNKLHLEFKILLNQDKMKGYTFLFITLFCLVLFNNFLGLFPHIFTSTSHMIMTLSLSLPMWLSFMLFGWINNSQNMFSHLIPQGTPPILMPFMVLIETISNIIRPGTLAIRLTANMIAGHLLMNLLGSTGTKMSNYLMIILIFTQFLLLTLELAVSIIQSYVIAILSTLYSSEVN